MNHKEFSRKGGLAKTEKKRNSGIINLRKAREARARKAALSKNANTAEKHFNGNTNQADSFIVQKDVIMTQGYPSTKNDQDA
jgi:Tfp pilus assembly protein PilE